MNSETAKKNRKSVLVLVLVLVSVLVLGISILGISIIEYRAININVIFY